MVKIDDIWSENVLAHACVAVAMGDISAWPMPDYARKEWEQIEEWAHPSCPLTCADLCFLLFHVSRMAAMCEQRKHEDAVAGQLLRRLVRFASDLFGFLR